MSISGRFLHAFPPPRIQRVPSAHYSTILLFDTPSRATPPRRKFAISLTSSSGSFEPETLLRVLNLGSSSSTHRTPFHLQIRLTTVPHFPSWPSPSLRAIFFNVFLSAERIFTALNLFAFTSPQVLSANSSHRASPLGFLNSVFFSQVLPENSDFFLAPPAAGRFFGSPVPLLSLSLVPDRFLLAGISGSPPCPFAFPLHVLHNMSPFISIFFLSLSLYGCIDQLSPR